MEVPDILVSSVEEEDELIRLGATPKQLPTQDPFATAPAALGAFTLDEPVQPPLPQPAPALVSSQAGSAHALGDTLDTLVQAAATLETTMWWWLVTIMVANVFQIE